MKLCVNPASGAILASGAVLEPRRDDREREREREGRGFGLALPKPATQIPIDPPTHITGVGGQKRR